MTQSESSSSERVKGERSENLVCMLSTFDKNRKLIESTESMYVCNNATLCNFVKKKNKKKKN